MKQPKRFYKEASIAEEEGGRWQVLLDGTPLRTPARHSLQIPSPELAALVAEEWNAQGEHIATHAMPAMGVVSLSRDIIAPERARILKEMLDYIDTDTICYRAEGPDTLIRRQQAAWEPLRQWMEERYGITLAITQGVMPVPQPEGAKDVLAELLAEKDELWLAALFCSVKITASLAIALALSEGRITGEQAFAAAFLDALYQREQWGADEEAEEKRALLRQELLVLERIFALL